MRSWLAAPSVLVAGSRPAGQSPAKPLPSRTVIDPPETAVPLAMEPPLLVTAVGVEDALPVDELLHAAATAATAIPMQAVRTDFSRNLTAFTYS
jgi:hypothetical protein